MPVGIRREENQRKGKEKEGRGGKWRSLIIIAEKFFSLEKAMDIWVQNTQRKPRFNQKSPSCNTLQSGFADNPNGWCDGVLEAKPGDQEYHTQHSYRSELRDKQKWEEFIATGPTFQEVLTEVLSFQWVITTTIKKHFKLEYPWTTDTQILPAQQITKVTNKQKGRNKEYTKEVAILRTQEWVFIFNNSLWMQKLNSPIEKKPG